MGEEVTDVWTLKVRVHYIGDVHDGHPMLGIALLVLYHGVGESWLCEPGIPMRLVVKKEKFLWKSAEASYAYQHWDSGLLSIT